MYPITVAGEKLLREELKNLIKNERPQIIQAIARARELGDLKENAEYHTAKDRQGFIEARIRDIEAKLSGVRIIDIKEIPPADRVIFGCTMTLRSSDNSKVKYQIVGDDEANGIDKISYLSPVAKAAIGKNVHTKIEVDLPKKKLFYKIEKVEHI